MITRKDFLTRAGAAALAAPITAQGASIGVSGRARGLMGGAFMGTLLAQNTKPLPYDCELEWLKSAPDCRIDTGIRPEDTDVLSWTAWADPHVSGMNIWVGLGFSSYLDEATEATRLLRDNGNSASNRAYFRNIAGQGGTVIRFDNTVPHDFVLSLRSLSVDGVRYAIGFPGDRSESRGNYVFGGGTNINVYLSWWKLERGDVPLVDMIPVRIGTEGAMYDKVSGQLFRNQGTGAYIVGPDKTDPN